MTLDDLRRELSRGALRGAYLLAGEEALLRDDALDLLCRTALRDGSRDFNFDRLDGDSATGARLIDAVRSLPVMAPHRVVVLREPEQRRAVARGLTDAIADVLPELVESSPASTVLIVTAAKIDRRSRWVRAFEEPAAVVRCEPPRRLDAVLAFVRNEVRSQGLQLERGAAELLVERVGPELLTLRSEIAKAGLMAGESARIARAHVAASTSNLAEEPIWDLTDAIGQGRTADALGVLAKLLRSGAPPVVMVGSLASHFRKLVRARSGERLAGPPFVVRKLEGQAQRYAPERLVAGLRAIHETDLALKGKGGLPAQLALERLVLALSC